MKRKNAISAVLAVTMLAAAILPGLVLSWQ